MPDLIFTMDEKSLCSFQSFPNSSLKNLPGKAHLLIKSTELSTKTLNKVSNEVQPLSRTGIQLKNKMHNLQPGGSQPF